MNKVTKYVVCHKDRVTGRKVESLSLYDTIAEAAEEIVKINFDDLDQKAYDFAAEQLGDCEDDEKYAKLHDEKFDELKRDIIDGVTFDDDCGNVFWWEERIEITDVNECKHVVNCDGHEIDGEMVTVQGGVKVILCKSLNTPCYSDDSICVYEAIDELGYPVAVASDNASLWLIGDDDYDVNRGQFTALESQGVNWDDIESMDLFEYIRERRESAESNED